MKITVRKAVGSDINWLLGQLRDLDKWAAYKHSFVGEREYAHRFFAEFIEKHFLLIAEGPDGRFMGGVGPLAFIAGYLHPHFFNPKLACLTEILWWVDPPYRRTRAGLLLLKEFVKYGRAHCQITSFSLQSHTLIGEDVLRREGFVLKEKSYLLEA